MTLIAAALVVASAQTAPPPDFFLTVEQMDRLRTTKQAIYLPTYIPKDFKTAVYADVEKEEMLTGYRVDYVLGPKEFRIQSASEGIGDMMLQDENGGDIEGKMYSVKHPTWGKIPFEVGPRPFRRFVVNWIEVSKTSFPKYVALGGNGLEPQTIQRIVASIRQAP